MKCAKCGHDIPDSAPHCPGCAAGYTRPPEQDTRPREQNNRVRCPLCGSPEISAVRRNYNPGCGCLGALLFGWAGLLLGLLGAGNVDLVCHNCGATWKAGHPGSFRTSGCGFLLILLLLVILLKCFIF